ncbi:DUF423 domain-containing protein [Roseibium sp.]|uniref:DUF423 domain-containing protein n=1 Tax=Roseibium sp. TaxID=1936156 RepID=UPI003A97BA48
MSDHVTGSQPAPTAPLLRTTLVLAGISGALGIMMMAAGAHVDTTGYVTRAGEMLLFHAPALLALGALMQVRRIPILALSLVLLVAGLGLFCGDLISRAFLDQRLFPMSAPIGGTLLILGWASIAVSAIRVRPH